VKSKKGQQEGEGEDGEENYEIGEGEAFTTLRKSAAFALEKLSSKCN
jgi:hypothetical protein